MDFGTLIRKAVEHFKWRLMGHFSRSKGYSGAEGDLNWAGLFPQDISEEKEMLLCILEIVIF